MAVLPAEAALIEADCYVVVDVLRATTTLAVLCGREVKDVLVVDDIGRARGMAKEQGRLVFGEEHGLAPEGFDGGNSPVEVAGMDLAGKGTVLFTTNGTRALCSVAGRGAVAAGALVNLPAVVGWARGFERVAVVCAGGGRGERFALDDFMAAGAIVRAAMEATTGVALGDAARAALSVSGHWGDAGVRGSEHAGYVRRLGLGEDVEYALRVGMVDAVPVAAEWGEGWVRMEAAG